VAPSSVSNQDQIPGQTFRFSEFVPPSGPFAEISPDEVLIASLREHVDRAPWRYMRKRVAYEVISLIQQHGLRFVQRCKDLGALIGRSVSTAAYHLRKLREEGFLEHYRESYVDLEASAQISELVGKELWISAPAVHQVPPERFRSSDDTFDPRKIKDLTEEEQVPRRKSALPPAETSLTCGDENDKDEGRRGETSGPSEFEGPSDPGGALATLASTSSRTHHPSPPPSYTMLAALAVDVFGPDHTPRGTSWTPTSSRAASCWSDW